MRNHLITLTLSLFVFALGYTQSIVESLADVVRSMESGDSIELHYSFVGCFGPYHHGVVRLSMDRDLVLFHSKSFNQKGQDPISQAGSIGRSQLMDALADAHEDESDEILGNVINFKILTDEHLLAGGSDRITQKHFVEIFHPFTSLIKTSSEFPIPKVSSGGIVRE